MEGLHGMCRPFFVHIQTSMTDKDPIAAILSKAPFALENLAWRRSGTSSF
jgi:hypothetical protein